MNKLCKTCQHWKPNLTGLVGECDFVSCYFIPLSQTFDVVATADDDSNLQVKLETGPEFGCVHHQEKEEKK